MAEDHVKQEIVRVSLERFLGQGIRKMTVQKLVEPLGMSTKTVYKYFSDKEDLLAHCLLLQYQRNLDELENMVRAHDNPVVVLASLWYRAADLDFGVNRVFYHDLNHYYPDLQDSVLKKSRKRFTVTLLRVFEQGKSEGLFRRDILPEMIFDTAGILYASITRTDSFKKFKISPREIIRNTVETYFRGVCTEKGIRELERNYSLITKNQNSV